MYNYYQPQQRPQPQQFGLKGRLVASIEEVKAAPIDFDGSIAYFPDLSNNKIYTKQFNPDGTVTLLMYELKEIPKEEPKEYITRQEFEEVIKKLSNSKVASNF